MRRLVLVSGLAVLAALAGIWAMGGFAALADWALGQQRAVQNSMATGIRAVRAGEAGALAALLAVAFTYGFVHAVGPGHGKVLIGGYGMGRRVRLWPLVGLAFASSMAQAAVAVAVVYALFAVLGWTRERVLGITDQVMAPVGLVLIAAVGLWLVWRGGRGLRRGGTADAPQHGHDGHGHGHHGQHQDHHPHTHSQAEVCETCGHAHGPTLAEVSALTGWRDTAALVAGIAGAGVLGTFVMGLGTASVTMVVALLAVWSREGMLAGLSEGRLARAMPVIELLAGAVVVIVALQMLRMSV